MILYPAIDLKDGACVRLLRGDMDAATVFGTDPAAQAAAFAGAGAEWLHLVDLNGAFAGRPVNGDAVQAILQAVEVPVQLGGGIRDMDTIEGWLDRGVTRVILGTVAVEDPSLVAEAAAAFPGRIAVGIDARGGRVATRGWADQTDLDATDLARRTPNTITDAAALFDEIAEVRKEKESAIDSQDFEGAARLRDQEKTLIEEKAKREEEWRNGDLDVAAVVDEEVIAEVLAASTGIPVFKLSEEESSRLLNMEAELHKRVVGNDDAIKSVRLFTAAIADGLAAEERAGRLRPDVRAEDLAYAVVAVALLGAAITAVLVFALAAQGGAVPELPAFDMDSLMTVLMGMLGLGGLRTYEKLKGVAK